MGSRYHVQHIVSCWMGAYLKHGKHSPILNLGGEYERDTEEVRYGSVERISCLHHAANDRLYHVGNRVDSGGMGLMFENIKFHVEGCENPFCIAALEAEDMHIFYRADFAFGVSSVLVVETESFELVNQDFSTMFELY